MDPLYYSKAILKTELTMLELSLSAARKLPMSDDTNEDIRMLENQITDLKLGLDKLEN